MEKTLDQNLVESQYYSVTPSRLLNRVYLQGFPWASTCARKRRAPNSHRRLTSPRRWACATERSWNFSTRSAIRNTELRLLEVDHVDLARLQLRVEHGKGRKGRMVPLGEPAAQWLQTYLRDGRPWLMREPFPTTLFLNSLGRVLSREALAEMVREHAQKAGLRGKVTPHTLRHCCATHMLARRAGLRHLQQLLGHASADTTKRYTRVEISDLREVHQRCHPRETS